jgi:ankyrin repeat protein
MKHLLLTTIAAVLVVGCGPPKAPDISIHTAVGRGNIEAVKQHLAAGTDVNAKDKKGFTPLHKVGSGRINRGRNKEVAELLIANGADLEAKTNQGYTPLCHACTRSGKSLEVVELLIVKGADVNYVNAKVKGEMTQLDHAILVKRTELANLLRKHGGKTKKELKAAGN